MQPTSEPPLTQSPTPPALPPRPRRRVVLNLVFSVFTRVQGAVFSYLTTYLLLRALSIEEYGLYTVLFIATINNLGLLGRLGLPNLLTRFIPEYFAESRFRLIAHLFRATNLVQTGASALLLALTFIFAPQIGAWINFPNSEAVVRIFAVGAFSYLLAENYRILLGGLFMHDTIFWRNLIYNAVRLAAIVWATRQPNPLKTVVIAEAALYSVSLLLFYLSYRRAVLPRVAADPHPAATPPWPRFTRYAALSYVNEVGVMLLNSATDLFLVSGFLGSVATGLYGLANRIMALVYQVLPSNFLSAVITPLFFSEYGASRERARFGFTLLVKISLLMTIPLSVWLTLMARPLIVELFDPRYADAAGILMVMALSLPLETLRYPLGLLLLNAERNDLLIYSKSFGVLKILVGVWWLSHGGGILEMAIITALAIAGQNLLVYYWIETRLKTRTDLAGIGKISFNGLLSLGLFYPLVPLFDGSVIGVIGSIPVYLALYLGISVVHKSFGPEERDFINQHLRRPVWKF